VLLDREQAGDATLAKETRRRVLDLRERGELAVFDSVILESSGFLLLTGQTQVLAVFPFSAAFIARCCVSSSVVVVIVEA
jgi:hypothetical protein